MKVAGCSLHGGEVGLEALSLGALLLPACRDGLPLSVELHCALSVEVRCAPHAVLVSSEGEHGERDGDRKVDANLACLNFSLELASSVAVLCEDCSTIAPSVFVDEIDGALKRVSTYDLHNRAEDLLIVAVDASAHVVDNGRSNEITIRIAVNLDATAVKKKAAVLLTIGDQTLNLCLVLWVV